MRQPGNMPRAFLIDRRRYAPEMQEYSPEHSIRLADYPGATSFVTSDGASECGSESSSECPEELYNLTKLAEVSLAAAAGTLVHPSTSARLQSQHTHHTSRTLPTMHFFDRSEDTRIMELGSPPDDLYRSDVPPVNFTAEERQHPEPAPSPPSCRYQKSLNAGNSCMMVPNEVPVEEHECPDCGKKYSTSSNLARHRQTHRSLGDKKARRCPHCDKVYVSIPAYSMHVRTHNQGCKCHFCGKCFSRPWLLQGHIRTHTGEKPFKCTICMKAFADKSNLRAHIQTHSNTKPHVCARCGKAFALKSYLYKHEESSCMRSHHRRETSSSPTSTSSSSSSNSSSQPVASPTSVIVPPRNSAFSAIVKHTRNDDCDPQESEQRNMVIRTSVISQNPEHRYGEKRTSETLVNFNDPSRVSAFSRPQSMTLNLAIA